MMVAIDELRRILSYDSDTGVFTWKVRRKGTKKSRVAGAKMSHGYVAIGIDGVDYTAHRLAWFYTNGHWPSGVIDHINGDKSDNRIGNLRDTNQVINMINVHSARSDSSTGVRGVSWHKQRNKYTARLQVGKKYLSLGLHDTIDQAKKAYDEAKLKYHGI